MQAGNPESATNADSCHDMAVSLSLDEEKQGRGWSRNGCLMFLKGVTAKSDFCNLHEVWRDRVIRRNAFT